MFSPAWKRAEQVLARPRLQPAVFVALVVAFVLIRWRERLEPWTSDDLDLFQISVSAASGQHWLFGAGPTGVLSHQALRIGLFPVSLPAIVAFGASGMAFYLVPLAFALLGFGLMYWVALRSFGAFVALALAVVHLLWPFELQHSSVFLSDLPSAASALGGICCVEVAAHAAPPRRLAYALLAGLALLESQLLRNNALVLLAPALLILLASRASRGPTLWACAVVLAGMLAFEALLAYRGLGWGYDWRRVHDALAEYSPFLPVYPWGEFLLRQFDYQFHTFGDGPTGWLGVGLLIFSLLGHALLLGFERRRMLMAIAAWGAFSWLVFSFSIYERVPGGVRAMAPPNYRYLQPFAYSSLLVYAWLWCALRERAQRTAPMRWAAAIAGPALLLLLLGFCAAALRYLPPTYAGSRTEGLVQALQRHSDGGAPLRVAGTTYSLSVARLFCCSGSRPVEWQVRSPAELADDIASRRGGLVLRDGRRERTLARYFRPDERADYLRDLSRLEKQLRKHARLEYADTKYALFAVPSEPPTP
jgi:hypothetical protein